MNNKIVTICISASVIVHIIFFTASNFITVSGMEAIKNETKAIFKIKRVDKEPIEIRRIFGLAEQKKTPSIKMAMPLSEIKETMLKDIPKQEVDYIESPLAEKVAGEVDKDIELYPVKKTPKEVEQDMIKIEADVARKDIKVKRKFIADK